VSEAVFFRDIALVFVAALAGVYLVSTGRAGFEAGLHWGRWELMGLASAVLSGAADPVQDPGKRLPHLIVQIADDVAALLLLGVNEAPQEALPRRGLTFHRPRCGREQKHEEDEQDREPGADGYPHRALDGCQRSRDAGGVLVHLEGADHLAPRSVERDIELERLNAQFPVEVVLAGGELGELGRRPA